MILEANRWRQTRRWRQTVEKETDFIELSPELSANHISADPNTYPPGRAEEPGRFEGGKLSRIWNELAKCQLRVAE